MKFLEPENYQPAAAEIYRRLSLRIREVLPEAVIEHIGSSSVPGLISKGDLDVYVGVDFTVFEESIQKMESLGFTIKQNTLRTDSLCPFVSLDEQLDIGIQLVANGSQFESFLTFRELLLSSNELRTDYNNLKISASKLTDNEYRQVKSRFIESVLNSNK